MLKLTVLFFASFFAGYLAADVLKNKKAVSKKPDPLSKGQVKVRMLSTAEKQEVYN